MFLQHGTGTFRSFMEIRGVCKGADSGSYTEETDYFLLNSKVFIVDYFVHSSKGFSLRATRKRGRKL
jgi:hypothetical protein